MNLKAIWGLVKDAAEEWARDNAARLGAALSYYTIFAIPPLFVIVIFVASLLLDEAAVRTELFAQVGGLVGEKGADAIQSALRMPDPQAKGLLASIIAVGTLILTATGLFIELQSALNTIWGVEAKPGQGIKGFILNRLLSFAMVVGIGFLLMVSLLVSAVLSAMAKYVSALMPGMDVLWMIVNGAVSFGVITVLFAMIYKVLPDVKIAWRDVWIGAATTSLLFTGGKLLLGMYLGRNTTVSAYGAAGSVVLILLWVYYSAQILFFGAELTQVYANRFGARLESSAHARWISPPRAERERDLKSKREPKRGRKAELVSELKEEINYLRDLVHH